jgi:hypothetical protein
MPLVFSCSCGKKLKIADANVGKKVRCPACGQLLTAPAPAGAGEDPLQALLVPPSAPLPEVMLVEKALPVEVVDADRPSGRPRRRREDDEDAEIVELVPVKNRDPRRKWLLELGADEVRLRDDRGKLVIVMDRAEANPRIAFPSFFLSVKYLQIYAEDQTIFEFLPDKEALQQIHEYLDVALREDPRARTTLKRRGIMILLFGLALLIGGSAFLAVEITRGTLLQPGRLRIASPFAGILMGIIFTVWGIAMYRKAVRLGRDE